MLCFVTSLCSAHDAKAHHAGKHSAKQENQAVKRCRKARTTPHRHCRDLTRTLMKQKMPRSWAWDKSLQVLWKHESGWNYRALNPSSGAYGIPQSLPASKMRSAGSDYISNPRTQIRWGLRYIIGRYGNPHKAMVFWRCTGQCWTRHGYVYKRNHWY